MALLFFVTNPLHKTTQDDEYMDAAIVCTGLDTYDTRPSQACRPCRTECSPGSYVADRCVRNNTPSRDTARCVSCRACGRGQYVATPCSGLSFRDDRVCVGCAYGSNGTSAGSQCGLGTYLVNECMMGTDQQDLSNCSSCNSTCAAANFSEGYSGQFIWKSCNPGEGRLENACANCDGRCSAFDPSRPNERPGQYIAGFCTGLTSANRQCVNCRTSCSNQNEFIRGQCTGIDVEDTSSCSRCTPQPSANHYTLNPCNGMTRSDQEWIECASTCAAGEYIEIPCSNLSSTKCSACKTSCGSGSYMAGSCDGTTAYDAVRCLPCRPSCPVGQFRLGAGECTGNTTADTVTCAPCRANCSHGEFIFGTCPGTGTFDETSCKQCTVCPRDRYNAYNSIYRSCNGTDTEDVVACALNAVGSTMVGDSCPVGHFVVGRLDAIDGALHEANSDLVIRYNGISPILNQLYGSFEPGEYMLISTTARSLESVGGSSSSTTSTALQLFQVCAFLSLFRRTRLFFACDNSNIFLIASRPRFH